MNWESSIPQFYANHDCIQTWNIKDKTTSQWSSLIGRLSNVYVSDVPVFTYHDRSIAAARFPLFKSSDSLEQDVLASDILQPKKKKFHSKKYRYFSGNIKNSSFKRIRSLLATACLFSSPEFLSQNVSQLVWMGEPGITATSHYDAVHNVYVQLHGSKRIRLLPPSKIVSMKIFGRFHPHACQSRIVNMTTGGLMINRFDPMLSVLPRNLADETLSCIERDSMQQAIKYSGYDFYLNAGDVLYIPPFWFHEVTALSSSVSVSFWWDAPQLDVMDGIYALPLPIEENWSLSLKQTILNLFFMELFIELGSLIDSKRILACSDSGQDITGIKYSKTNQSALSDDQQTKHLSNSGNNPVASSVWNLMSDLLANRYEEDFLRLRNSHPIYSKEIWRSNDADSILQKIASVATSLTDPAWASKLSSRAVLFATKFIQMIPSSQTSDFNTCSASDSFENDECINRVSILGQKLGDFIEDVFDFIAQNQEHSAFQLFRLLQAMEDVTINDPLKR